MDRCFTVIDAPQRSEAWFAARCGRLTGSVAKDMLAKLKDGKPAAGRTGLLTRLVVEQLTGTPIQSDYQSPAMLVGVEREDAAVGAFEALTGSIVVRTGFLAHTSLLAGASLDGHLGDFTELLSVKCRQLPAHYEFIRYGKIPGDALAQIRHELWVTGAECHHYFEWNPDFPTHMQSRLVTVKRADADIPGYDAEARKFLAEVEQEYAAALGWRILETAS